MSLVAELSSKEKAEACLAALFLSNPADDRAKLISHKGDVIPDVCTWILKNELYEIWNDTTSKGSQLLWLSGAPGMGKTMLSIFLTQKVEARLGNRNDMLLLYYFCDGRDERRNSAVCVLRGLIFQLMQQRPTMIKYLLQDYSLLKNTLFKENSLEMLWRVFENMMQNVDVQRIYCVLDGLDECIGSSLDAMLKRIRTFFETAANKPLKSDPLQKTGKTTPDCGLDVNHAGDDQEVDFRLMVVSRDGPVCISKELGTFPRIELSSDTSREYQCDLKRYMDLKSKDIFSAIKNSPITAASISSELGERGDGTFLWVALAAEKLKGSGSQPLLEQLDQLPDDIEGTYHQILRSIPDGSKYLVGALLRWVVLAVRPLKLEELEAALGLSVGTNINRNILTQMIDYCGKLVVCEDEISLIHQTAKDFLLGPSSSLRQDPTMRHFHMDEGAGHSEIAQACLTYIASGSLMPGPLQVVASIKSQISEPDQQRLTQYPFLSYAVINWPNHASHIPMGGLDFSSPFFAPKSKIREIWWESYCFYEHSRALQDRITRTPFSLLHIAAYFGLLPLAAHLENLGLLRDQMAEIDGHSRRAVSYAVQNAHVPMIVFLIDRGAMQTRANGLEEVEKPLLHYGVESSDVKLVAFLLDRGAHVDESSNPKWGYKRDISQINQVTQKFVKLLDRIPDEWHRGDWRNAQRGYGSKETAIHIAAALGYEEITLKLLEAGANVNSRTSGGWTPLHSAAWFGHNSTILALINHRAGVLMQSGDGWTSLHCAVHWGKADCVRLLLENGAQIETKSAQLESALHVASNEGHLAVVEMLLKNNADIESRTVTGATPLQVAVQVSKEAIVKLLLDHGANTATSTLSGETPEAAAVANGSLRIIEMLQAHKNPIKHKRKEVGLEMSLPPTLHSASDIIQSDVAPNKLEGQAHFPHQYQPYSLPSNVASKTNHSQQIDPRLSGFVELADNGHAIARPFRPDVPGSNTSSPGLISASITTTNTNIVDRKPLAADHHKSLDSLPSASKSSRESTAHPQSGLEYDSGLIPVSLSDASGSPPNSTLRTNSPDSNSSIPLETLSLNQALNPAPSVTSYPSPLDSNPLQMTGPQPISASPMDVPEIPRSPPPPYSGLSQSVSPPNSTSQTNSYFQPLSTYTYPPPPPVQSPSFVTSTPIMHKLPSPDQPPPPMASNTTQPSTPAISQSSCYNPSSYPAPPSRSRVPPPLPPRAGSTGSSNSLPTPGLSSPPISPPIFQQPNPSYSQNPTPNHPYSPQTVQPGIIMSNYQVPPMQSNPSFVQDPNHLYCYPPPPQIAHPSQSFSPPVQPQTITSYPQSPVPAQSFSPPPPPPPTQPQTTPQYAPNFNPNYDYSPPEQQLQPQPIRPVLSMHRPSSSYLSPSQGPVSPLPQSASTYMAPNTYTSPPSPYMAPTVAPPSPYTFQQRPALGQGLNLAAPTPLQGMLSVKKSRSFLDINIMGKKIL